MTAPPPPSKRDQLNKLFEHGSVFVHLDPRRPGVEVPPWLGKKPQLVLQLGLNFPIPIRDLEIDDEGVRCTLSFNRAPFYCVMPWSAVYALVGEDGQVTVWPADLPLELVPPAEPAVRRDPPRERRGRGQSNAASAEARTEVETPEASPAPRRGRLSVVPPAGGEAKSESDNAADTEAPPAEAPAAATATAALEPVVESIPKPAPAALSLAPAPAAPEPLRAVPAEAAVEPAKQGDEDVIVEPSPTPSRRPRERPSYLRVVK